MAVIRDMMPAFELFQPATTKDALALLDRHGRDAWVLAGGLDSFDWLKDRIKRPKVVVDIGGIGELSQVKVVEGGLEIGEAGDEDGAVDRSAQRPPDKGGDGGRSPWDGLFST